MNFNRIYWSVLAVSFFLCALILAPALGAGGTEVSAPAWVRAAFSLVCHQDPGRSFTINGVHLPVCARCTGAYLGFLAGWAMLGAAPRLRRMRPVSNLALVLCFAPLAADGLVNSTGLVTSPAWLRFLTGVLFGAAAALALGGPLREAGISLGCYLKKPGRAGAFPEKKATSPQ